MMKTYQIDSGVALVAMETRLSYDYQDVALRFGKCLYKQKIQIRFYISYTCKIYNEIITIIDGTISSHPRQQVKSFLSLFFSEIAFDDR